ncbi:UDP-N-acetylmuramoyl-L-alanyl-D-glutamate--2,6-diaminopimelate ligase [Pseudohaliea rubra]|uniref:UDP-N-acetylmuramoyl-L-alanyl-D-glutamate--2,6-diaminopimelate ligase n=1 Tax=Pseudohaliea rubra DSM 19751 TaxID=1265313 RepID=A0A095WXB5_9GAMM|nr:UDP-N-acetylmuramoyl-L-alanyl-D-glutamate--2,6-diaminopimelate ligase [Pseudohaliea rubra]KGE03254.1 UDP-N-acetylmuramoylalanyl-D-glutamate--2,6- diaminopimelate ligase [Pseudohaliea rubra DSM 19751]
MTAALQRAKTLAELLPWPDAPPVTVTGVSCDSRTVRPGDLFLACRGREHDGRTFIPAAVRAGAAAVVADAGVAAAHRPAAVPLLEVDDLAAALGGIASRFFDDPSSELAVVGVTGTNGKTTVSQLVGQLLRALDRPCGVIGTLGASLGDAPGPASLTTPDAVTLQAQLAAWRDQGVGHAALEVSSHALDQGRVNGLTVTTAIFTNLSRDHLDYHGSMRAYGEAKLRLFRHPGLRHAVINLDDPFGARVRGALAAHCAALTVSTRPGRGAAVTVAAPQRDQAGVGGTLVTPWGSGPFRAPLVGDYNLANVVAAAAAALSLGVALEPVLEALGRLRPAPGRLEAVPNDRGLQVVVDYAHTPDALEKVLMTLREQTDGRLLLVFGCGGDRDPGKRAPMGAVACAFADEVFVTSDNPRSEAPQAILDDIAASCSGTFHLEVDRAAAITAAVAAARAGDCVLIAGKGHEDYQVIGGERLPFSDVACARQALGVMP